MRAEMTLDEQRGWVDENIQKYRKIARRYDRKHGEIFNEVEQARLRAGLERAVDIAGTAERVLDVGSGTGNVTAHLVELARDVTAADVSPELLELLMRRCPQAKTVQIAGLGLREFDDDSFDVVTAYSVLHHIPDYLGMVDEMVRVTRPGGVVYIDHEWNDNWWDENPCIRAFKDALLEHERAQPGFWNPSRRRWQKFLIPGKYWFWFKWRFRQDLIFCDEGDIHIWPHDHVEWDLVEQRLEANGAEVAVREDYLHFQRDYALEVYEQWRERCSDMRLVIASRSA
jgi:ubiquinone/menaquinone biosynthesis C-methylase UbiE